MHLRQAHNGLQATRNGADAMTDAEINMKLLQFNRFNPNGRPRERELTPELLDWIGDKNGAGSAQVQIWFEQGLAVHTNFSTFRPV
jgi:hypothetical protein